MSGGGAGAPSSTLFESNCFEISFQVIRTIDLGPVWEPNSVLIWTVQMLMYALEPQGLEPSKTVDSTSKPGEAGNLISIETVI